MTYFKADLTKAQIEIILAFLHNEQQLSDPMSLREMAKITQLDYCGVLFRHREWLIDTKILIWQETGFIIDFDAIAELLFDKSNFDVIYRFAFRHLEYSL